MDCIDYMNIFDRIFWLFFPIACLVVGVYLGSLKNR
jgi:hypothetical protein